MGAIKEFGVASAGGFLAGLAAATWIDPLTDEGKALVIVICIAATNALIGIWRLLRRKSDTPENSRADE